MPELLAERMFIGEGGMETTLIYHEGVDLPCFASFPLLDDDAGRALIRAYYERYVAVARARGVGVVLDTATWRANPDWAARLGYTAHELDAANRSAVALADEVRAAHEDERTPIVVNGAIGPRGDGYSADGRMSADEAQRYHSEQLGTLADTAVDMVTALTLTYPEEAIGIVRAARARGLPSVVSFTVETDGRLPNGQALKDAIDEVDAQTERAPMFFMINCAHPTHFDAVLREGEPWLARIGGLRANASTRSHAELDAAQELDAGDPDELAASYRALRPRLGAVRLVGGCCGTDQRHVDAVCAAWLS
jgi:S-methylmethionine-dependent homocysteine/selenocysteine methylase